MAQGFPVFVDCFSLLKLSALLFGEGFHVLTSCLNFPVGLSRPSIIPPFGKT